MTDPILNVHNLQVQFKVGNRVVQAVDRISFEIQRGQTLGIVGESGSGKSVTALSVMGLVPNPGKVTAGEIWFRGLEEDAANPVDLLTLSAKELESYRGGKLSMIFQEPQSSLNPVYTCGFQLTEAIQLHQEVPLPEARRRAIALLQEVKLLPDDDALAQKYIQEWRNQTVQDCIKTGVPLEEIPTQPPERNVMLAVNAQKHAMMERYPHELSGGQIQRMMIAMAISCNPALLIADEPTTALDVTVQATILELLRQLRDRRGMSILFITHDLSIIADIADVVAVMYEGKIVEYGSVLEIFSNPQHPYTRSLLNCRPRPDRRLKYLPTVADFMNQEKAEANPNGQTNGLEGDRPHRFTIEISETEAIEHLTRLQQQAPLLDVRELQVGYPIRGMFGQTQRYLMAVSGVSFEVYPCETLGLVGESGCGKSTLARALLRLIKPIGGEIFFDRRDITHMPAGSLRQLRRQMQIIFQDPFSSLDPRMTIGEAVMEPLTIHRLGGSRRQRQTKVAELLERVGLDPRWQNRYPHEFSGGQRQRICIARALVLEPRFIICDESVSALDVSVQAQVLNLLKELQSEFKLTYIFISHDLSVVKFMSDRIMVMNRGRIEEIGPAEQIYRHPQQSYTRQLISAIPIGSLEHIRQRQAQRGMVVS